MQLSQNAFRTDLVFAAILVTSLLSLGLYWVVGVIRRLAIPWAPGVRREPGLAERPF
jgi:ABC-type nitrate/sulfonate/bicarbonate transport system permease component